ncbi:MAG: glycoside hydrolase family 28 protein [Planctomycetales bacterium]|nr:glycoside hydrolase family 28 protein [Planctomycetales bacterium]
MSSRSIAGVLLLAALPLPASIDAGEVAIPTAADVGPAAMPVELQPIAAPFEMATPQRPTFPDRVATLGADGAANASGLATTALQRLIDETSAAGGGTVVVPAGHWRCGRIVLRSHVNLHFADGAVVHFSGRVEDYLPPVFTRYEGLEIMGLGGLVYAHQAEDFAITGAGQLIGPDDGPVREARQGLSDQLVDPQSPVAERVFDGQQGRHYFRPYFITLVDCRGAWVEGVSLRHGPMWNIVPIMCDGVVVRGVTIHSRGVVNGDGVDVESSRNVLVEYCAVNTGDDCYALKAGRNADGVRTGRPVENVVMRHNYAAGGIGGVTCGSETAGGIRRVHVHDCVFDDVRFALYFKTRRPRGGGGEDLSFERIRFKSSDHAIFFDMLGSPLYVGELANRLPPRPVTPLTPYYRRITMQDLQGASGGYALKVKGIPESPATDLTLRDAEMVSRGTFHLTDAIGLTVANTRVKAGDPTIALTNVTRATFNRVAVDAEYDAQFVLVADEPSASDLTMSHCQPPRKEWTPMNGDR